MRSNLRIEKVADRPECEHRFAFGIRGWLCVYYIRITNTGPDPYAGPIEVQDLPPDPLSLPPGWVMRFYRWPASVGVVDPCFYGGRVPPIHTCRVEATLNPGDRVEFRVEVMIPFSRSRSHPCAMTNTARITLAPGGSAQNTDASDDESSVTTPFTPWAVGEGRTREVICLGSRSEPIVPEPPEPTACPQGWSRTPVPGKCCPPNTNWDGKQCRRGAPPPEERCPPNSDSAYKYPDCRCEPGFVGTPPNCKPRTIEPPRPPQCPPNSVGEYPNCRCPQGFTGTPPNCKRVVVPPPECPKGFVGTPPNCKPVLSARMSQRHDRQVSGLQADRVPERHDGQVSGLQADRVPERHDGQVSGLQADRVPERHDRQVSGLQADRVPERHDRQVSGLQADRVPERHHRQVSGLQAHRLPERHDGQVSGLQADRVPERHDRKVSGLQADRVPERHHRQVSGLQAGRPPGSARRASSARRQTASRSSGRARRAHRDLPNCKPMGTQPF